MRTKITSFLPERLKATVRPIYKKLFHGVSAEKSTNLQIKLFGGFEIAYREGTTDEIIIGNRSAYQLSNLLPGYGFNESDVIVNIGAHIGVFALIASSAVPRGKVYAIEASKDTFNLLRINVAINKAENICARHVAIADKKGSCILYHDIGHWGHSITKQLSTQTEVVESITLEDFLNEHGIKKCNFLYLNCEGAEFPILLGATPDTLQKFDAILADCHPYLWQNHTKDDLLSHLRESGFNAELLKSEQSYDRILATNSASQAGNA